MWLQRKGGAGGAEASLMARRAAAMSAMGAAMSALVDTYLEQAVGDEEVAFTDLMWDVPGVEAALAAARAMVERVSEAQLSRFLLTIVTFHLRGQEHSVPRRLLGTAITLGENLAQPIDPGAPVINAPALLELRRRLRGAITAEDVVFSRLSVTYRNVCQALGELLRRQAVDPRAFASQLLADELAAPHLSFPVLGWVAPTLDPSGAVLFPLMLEGLDDMAANGAVADRAVSDVQSTVPRLRAEIAYAAGDKETLAAALEAWPDAPYGEFLARASRRKPLTLRLAIAEAAHRAGRIRWVETEHSPQWSRSARAEHLFMGDLPSTYDPRIESIAIQRVHDDLPGHPAWAHIAIGDLVVLLADLDRLDDARRVLLDHARQFPMPAHRPEFERIWTAAGLGRGAPAGRDTRSVEQAAPWPPDELIRRNELSEAPTPVGSACETHDMKPSKLLAMSNNETESRAIAYVLAHERAAGRTAVDVHKINGSLVDVESTDDATGEKRLIEIKAFGGTGRGDFLWLESNQVEAFEQVPGSHLYIVTNVKSPEPHAIRVLDLTGEQLRERLAAKKDKHYYEVPLPVAVYDDLLAKALEAHSPTGDDAQDDVDSTD
ncbi:MAG: protein NO VEIN domain-containing protein [Brachybacterium sp.]